jgi:hypothetical protein
MHIVNDFWIITLHISLFLLLTRKIYGLSVNYLIPYLKQQLHFLKKEQVELLEKEKLVLTTLYKTKTQINDQEREFQVIEKKMQTCHENMLKNIENKQKEKNIIREKIKKRRKLQQENFVSEKIAVKTIPEILSLAEHDLCDFYSNKENKDKLFKDIIIKLNTTSEDKWIL